MSNIVIFLRFFTNFVLRSVGKVANGSLPQVRKGKAKKTDQLPPLEAGGTSREEPDAAAPVSRRSEGGDGDELLRSTRAASEFSADSPVSTLFHLSELIF